MSSVTDFLGGLFGGTTIGDIAGGVGAYTLADKSIEQARGLPAQLGEMATGIAGQVGEAASFKPYTVTTSGGSATYGPQGFESNLAQQGLIDSLYRQAGEQQLQSGLDLSGLAGGAFGGAEQALGAQSGAGVSALGDLYGRMGQGQVQNAQSPAELQRLQTAMTTQGLQAPTGASQNLLGLQGLSGQANFQGSGTDVSGAFSGIQGSPFQMGTTQTVQNQAMQGVGQAGQFADVSNAFTGVNAPDVRTGAGDFSGGLLSQAQQALQGDTPTAESLFEQIRATQTPEEERQRIALENRLAAQGRLGVNTAAYGGTPEQLAMEKAQAEARNNASLQAIGMADQLASSQQSRATQLGQLGLSGEQIQAQLDAEGFGQQMQLGQADLQSAQTQSALQSEAQSRANQLRQLGLSAEQIQNQLLSEGFGQEMQLAQAGIGAQQAQSDLENAAQARATQLAQLGMSAEQVASQLQSEGLARSQSSAQLAAQLAQTGAGISAQQQQLGQNMLGLGLQAQELGGQLGLQDLQRAQSMLNMGALSSQLPSQLTAQNIANTAGMLGIAGSAQQQGLESMGMGLAGLQYAQEPSRLTAQAIANLGGQQLAAVPSAINAEALLRQAQLESVINALGIGSNAASGGSGGSGGLFNLDVGELLGDGFDFLGGLFSGDDDTSEFGSSGWEGTGGI
jgi:hypothetical protein